MGRGCVMYTLSIMPKFHPVPHYQLGVLNFRVSQLGWSLHLGLTPWIVTKASTGPSFLGPSRCGHPLGRECVHSRL